MSHKQGFTLLELLVILSFMIVLSTSTFTLLGHLLPRWYVRKASFDIAFTLKAARAKAVLEQTDVTVPFDINRRFYTLVTETAPEGVVIEEVEGEILRLVRLPTGVSFTRPDEGNAVTFSPPEAPDEETALFDSRGILQSLVKPADVYLGVPDKGIFSRVRVRLAGTVMVECWNGTVWE